MSRCSKTGCVILKVEKNSSANTTLLPCERLVPNSARCLHRVKTFGEVQKPFSTNATLFRSSLCDLSSYVLSLDSIAVSLWSLSTEFIIYFYNSATFAKFYQKKKKHLYWYHKKDHDLKYSENLTR